MPNSQGTTLLFLALALALFFFSLALLPPVELYCRLRKPAIVLLILEGILIIFFSRWRNRSTSGALTIATFVFAVLGVVFNAVLLAKAAHIC
jgi:FtsH-binding integral membrane protein